MFFFVLCLSATDLSSFDYTTFLRKILTLFICQTPYVYVRIKSDKSLTEGDPMRRKTILTEEQAAQEQSTFFHKKAQKDIRWDKLDNTAHLFPVIAGERLSNTYRISVTLTEMVDPELLQQALDIVLPRFDGFNLRLRHGFFWYYFEENGKPAPRVKEEGIPMPLYPSK